jgi:hypothetical protein
MPQKRYHPVDYKWTHYVFPRTDYTLCGVWKWRVAYKTWLKIRVTCPRCKDLINRRRGD